MENKEIKAVVLAAGNSKRMKSGVSKVQHNILGKEIINYALDSLAGAGVKEENIIIVAGDNLDELKQVVRRKVQYVVQQEQLGTAHALLSAQEHLRGFDGGVLVTVGDNPYVTAKVFKDLIQRHLETGSHCTFISAVFPDVPPPYGRVIREKNNGVTGVVEELDATPEQRKIKEVNSGIYLFDNPVVFPLLFKIDNNNRKGEYYLTDIIHILKGENRKIDASPTEDYYVSIGINNRWELGEAQEKFNRDRLEFLAKEVGVTILQPDSVTVECDVEIGRDTVIYPNTYLAAGTRIGGNCRIGPFVYLGNTTVGDNETIRMEKRTGTS